jgi:hypothetical protein
MRAAPVIVAAKLLQMASQAGFVENDDMVQALAADRADDALDIAAKVSAAPTALA